MQGTRSALLRHTAPGPADRRDDARTGRSAGDRRPPRRHSGTVLLPPWTRAPGLGFGNPAVLFAIVAATAILACAASSAALFLSSSSSKALQRLIAARCEDVALPDVQVQTLDPYHSGLPGPFDAATYARLDGTAQRAFARAGLAAPERRMVSSVHDFEGSVYDPAYYYYGGRALANVTKLSSIAGRGVWVPISLVRLYHLSLGRPVPGLGGARLVGTYADLFGAPVRPYWCSQTTLFSPPSFDANTVNRIILATDPSTFTTLSRAAPDVPTLSWLAGSNVRSGMTATRADRLIGEQRAAQAAIAARVRTIHPAVTRTPYGDVLTNTVRTLITRDASALPDLRARTALVRRGLTGPVVPVAIGGSLLALLLVGAAGSYWVERRFREVRLLASRGVGPVALAAKAAAELAIPALIGTVLGLGIAIELVRLIGPSSDLDPAAPWQAALTAGVTFVAGTLLLAVVAGARASALTEERHGKRSGWIRFLPWDVAILAASIALYLRLRGESAIHLQNGVALVNLLLVAFPLLFLLGAATVLLRITAWTLPLLRRLGARLPTTGYFALNRITAAASISVTLIGAAAMPVGVLVYAGTTTATSRTTVDAKASLYAGANTALVTQGQLHDTPALQRVGTAVARYFNGTLGSNDAEVIAIDPSTFVRNAYWDHRFADQTLTALVGALGQRRSDGAVPAILIPYRYDRSVGTVLHLGQTTRRLHIVAVPRAFPGLHDQYADYVVVAASQLRAVDPTVARQYELWSDGGAKPAGRVLAGQGDVSLATISRNGVIDATNYVALGWTFDYLQALAVLVGIIALGALLLYLGTRQRSRTASYALARRMGLSRRAHRRSLVIELSVLLGAAYVMGVVLGGIAVGLVYRRLDPDPSRPPTALLTLPTTAVIGAGLALLAAALTAAVAAQAISDRANFGSVLRTDA